MLLYRGRRNDAVTLLLIVLCSCTHNLILKLVILGEHMKITRQKSNHVQLKVGTSMTYDSMRKPETGHKNEKICLDKLLLN